MHHAEVDCDAAGAEPGMEPGGVRRGGHAGAAGRGRTAGRDGSGDAGPGDAGLTINYYIYIKGVQQSEMEYASVMSWALFLVTFVISFFVIRARNKAAED